MSKYTNEELIKMLRERGEYYTDLIGNSKGEKLNEEHYLIQGANRIQKLESALRISNKELIQQLRLNLTG